MKRSCRIIKVLSACFVLSHFLVSCHEKNDADDNKHEKFLAGKLIKGDIRIIAYDMADGSLTLIDEGNHNAVYGRVTRNQKIKWVIDADNYPDMDNFQIDGIYADPNFPNPPDFYSELPALRKNHWAARINGDNLDPKKGFLEKYIIAWKIDGKSQPYIADPIMQLNPI